MKIEDIKPNQVVSWLYDTGALGWQVVVGRVIRITPSKRVRIRTEYGNLILMKSHLIEKVLTDKDIAEWQEYLKPFWKDCLK